MNDSVRLRMSWSLVALAIAHAVVLGGMCLVSRSGVIHSSVDPQWQPPAAYHGGQYSGQHYEDRPAIGSSPIRLEDPTPVNIQAQGELKQQCPPVARPGSPCASNPFNLRPGERLLSVGDWQAVQNTPAVAYNPIPYAQTPTIPAQSSFGATYGQSGQRSPAKTVQVLLFLDSSDRSRELASWWDTNPRLTRLRAGSAFQVYTASSPLYRERLYKVVPANQFPVCLVQDATGGHIHAAGKQMIPATADELMDDIVTGHTLYKQAKQGAIQQTGALKTAGYSWDDAIDPAMRLSSSDCVDGSCDPNAILRPGGNDSDGLFNRPGPSNRDGNPLQALLWASTSDLATIFVFGLAAVLLVFVLARRR